MACRAMIALCVVVCLLACGAAFAVPAQLVEVSTSFSRVTSASANAADGTAWVADESVGVAHVSGDGRLLARVASIWGVEGTSVAVNVSDGTTWVTDTVNSQVVHLRDNGDRTVTELLRASGFSSPWAVAVDPNDGSVWIADSGNAEVVHLQDNGDGTATELVRAGGFIFPFALAVYPADGTVWVCDGNVVHLQDNGDGTATELLRDDSSVSTHAQAIAIDPNDGTAWIASDYPTHLRDNGDGTATVLAEATGVFAPNSVSVNPSDGTCWASASGDQLFQCRDNGDGSVTVLNSLMVGSTPWVVSVDGEDGSCWVGGDGCLARYGADGVERVRTPHLFSYHGRDVAANAADGSVWVTDGSYAAVAHVNRVGTEVARFEWVSGDVELGNPLAVSVNQTDGTCWVALEWGDSGGAAAHLRDNGDGTITELARIEGYAEPQDISVNSADGTCWLANTYDGQAVHLRDNGDGTISELVRAPNCDGTDSISVDPTDGTCWVSASWTADVVHLQDNGDGTSTELLRVHYLGSPTSVAADPNDGTCWVAEPYHSLVVHLRDNGDGTATELATATGTDGWRELSVNPSDSTCWASGSYAVGQLQDNGDGTTSVLAAYSIPYGGLGIQTLSVDAGDGSCWVIGSEGLSDYPVVYRLWEEAAPAADFSGSPTSGPAPLGVVFGDLSSGYPVSWVWDFGDGSGSARQNPAHEYVAEGAYTVSLTVGNGTGTDTVVKPDYISVGSPGSVVAAFGASPTAGPAPLQVHFTDESTGSPTSWAWDFGDGGSSTQQDPVHEYLFAGSYTVALTVSDGLTSDTMTKPDYIEVTTPTGAVTASFSGDPLLGAAPLEVAFTDTSTGDPTSWLWDFGDGTTSDVPSPTHTYTAAGHRTVSLVAANEFGDDTATYERYVTVLFPDVLTDHWAWEEVLACVDAGIVEGYLDGLYRPSTEVTRDQMAAYIARGLAGGDANVPSGPATATFGDVLPDDWAYPYVEYCAAHDIVAGYWDGYHPERAVTRAQMAVYVARAIATPTGDAGVPDLAEDFTATFPDVPGTDNAWAWCWKYVEYCAAHDVVAGYWDGYHPERVVTRDQMAVYVQHAFNLPM